MGHLQTENVSLYIPTWLQIPNVMLCTRHPVVFQLHVSIFFADSPQMMKTARNCLYNSGSGSCSRYMWNDGNYLLFRHIANLFNSDQEFALHSLPKITMDHIVLTSYSKMKVKLATQVLSKSIAISLRDSDNDEVPGTVTFCEMMNDMFDCTNVRSKTEHARKTRKYFIKPYTSCDDERFVSMKNVVLKYLENWRESILSRPEKYTADERGKIFIWMQTYEGLKNLKIYLTTAVMFFKIIQVCPDYPWTSFAAELVYVVK